MPPLNSAMKRPPSHRRPRRFARHGSDLPTTGWYGNLGVPADPPRSPIDQRAGAPASRRCRLRRAAPAGVADAEPTGPRGDPRRVTPNRVVGGALMPRGLATKTVDLVAVCHDILEVEQPLTVRGVCYRLFNRKLIP